MCVNTRSCIYRYHCQPYHFVNESAADLVVLLSYYFNMILNFSTPNNKG